MIESQTDPTSGQFSAMMDTLMADTAIQFGGGPTIKDVAEQHLDIMSSLKKLSPTQAALAFGSLLTVPALQANCLRLETLVHMALMGAEGTRSPTNTFVRSAFTAIGKGICGQLEDPAEDMFIGTVNSPRGNFRIIEGIWEGNSFYLQRFINVVEEMPRGPGYDDLRGDIYALLTLSDLICERADLKRHQLGAEFPIKFLGRKFMSGLDCVKRRIGFSLSELEQAGIEPLSLAPFLFDPRDRKLLAAESLGASSLERNPLIRERDQVSLALPTAVSAAIRYHVIDRMRQAGMLEPFMQGTANEYAQHFSSTPLLGGRFGTPISFSRTHHGMFASVITGIDKGRHLNLVFFTDSLVDLDKTGLAGMNPDRERMENAIKRHVDEAYRAACGSSDFVDCVTVIVGCGVGRGVAISLEREGRANWHVEFLSAYDLDTLSWTPRFKPLSLWRLLNAREHLEALGVGLQNINGLLNLVAWTRSLDGHLIPHGSLPDDFVDGVRAVVMINQNSQRSLRSEVATTQDVRVVQDIEGRWVPVRRDEQSNFSDDRAAPLYASDIPSAAYGIMTVYLAPNRAWWAEVGLPENTLGRLAYERWRLVTGWLSRAAKFLDGLAGLPPGPVRWRAEFETAGSSLRELPMQLTFQEAREAITVRIDAASKTVTTTASSNFDDAIYHPENIAERALVDALIEGFLALSGAPQSARPALLLAVIPDVSARHAHAFAGRTFRDFVQDKIDHRLIRIDRDDDAAVRLGLGWTVRDRSLGGRLSGKTDTIAFLNAVVTAMEDDLCGELRAFNQEALLTRLLMNHEAAACDRDRWRKTAAAVLALHSDRQSSLATMGDHEFELNGIFQTSRILIEMAICEANLDGGREAGDLDLSRLMAKAALIFHIGGWSDAIRWDVMEPTIRITALGDVHAQFDYVDDVIEPHSRNSSDIQILDAVGNYVKNLEQIEGTIAVTDQIDREFSEAWEEQFGVSFQDVRIFVDWLENRGISLAIPIIRLTQADFDNVTAEGQNLAPDVVTKLIEMMTLSSRPSWRKVPDGFDDRDRQPWRFRRRLSPIRRPLLKIGRSECEQFLIAPGMVRESFAYMVRSYLRGDFPTYQLAPKMRRWAGHEAHVRGAKFTQEVAGTLRALGWNAETEVKITKILGKTLDRDYGDVDVLAWNPDYNRVLVIECKDLQFKKTYGEVCEQIADFRGELRSNGKPDDLLKHLNRMTILNDYLENLKAYIKFCDSMAAPESHLVFRYPVPMEYALSKLSERVTVSTFEGVAEGGVGFR